MSPASDPEKRRSKKPKHPTWEHPRGSGIRIAEIPSKTGGVTYGTHYQIRIPARLLGRVGDREFHHKPTKAEAERYAEDRFAALRRLGSEFSKIPAREQAVAAMAWNLLHNHNQEARLNLNLLDVVKAGIRVLSPVGGVRTFAQVAEELRASKKERMEAGDVRAATESDFRRRSQRLEATALGAKLVSEITGKDVADALRELKCHDGSALGKRSLLNFRNTLAEIMRHAHGKQYTPTNPMEHLVKEDVKRLGGLKAERNSAPNILKVEEARSLLNAALAQGETGMLATLVLRLFCGLRTAEVAKQDWRNVHWLDAEPFVTVLGGNAKTRQTRNVTIPENALAWLRLCNPPKEGKLDQLSPKTYAKRFGRIARAAGIGSENEKGEWVSGWEHNDTRHSFGSYHYALYGDAVRTAGQMGHRQGDDTLFKHYRALTKRSDGEAYFSIMPPTESGTVTEFPRAASASA